MAAKPKTQAKNILDFFKVEKRRRYKALVVPPQKMARSLDDAREQVMAMDFKAYAELSITFKPAFIGGMSEHMIRDKLEVTILKCLKLTEQYMMRAHQVDRIYWNPHIVLIAEHGPNGDHCLHYHGVIAGVGNDVKYHLLKILRARIGRTTMTYIKYEKSYKEYMFKSYSEDLETPEIWGYHSYIEINYG